MPLPDEFHLCVQYYRQPTPLPAEWEQDLEHVSSLGFTAVQLRPQWAWHEPREGSFRWDDIDRLMELTAALGLKVLFKFILESAPAWLFTNYEARRFRVDGVPIQPKALGSYYLGGWFACFDRPLVRQKAERFIVEGVKRYRGCENLLGWHVWNEPRSRPFADCACEDSNRAYRDWLSAKFGEVEAFNSRFGTAFSAWEDFRPPPDLSAYFDTWLWRTWRAHAVAGRIQWLADLVRANDPGRPVFCHVGFNTALQPTLLDTSHDWLTARAVDVFGTSFPHWTGDFHTFFSVDKPALFSNPRWCEEAFLYSLQTRWIAAVKDYFWINEVYGNNWNYLAEDYTGEDMRFMLLVPVSEGARGIVIWQFRPERFSEESITSGLIEPDGSDTDRSRAAGMVCKARQRDPEAFLTFRPEPAQAAVVFDFGADMYSEIEDAEDLSRAGTVCYRYKDSLKGYYSLLWQLGLAVDLVPVEALERISGYRLVVLPYQHLLEEEQAELLKKYVAGGGTLVSDPGLAFRDGRAWVHHLRPGWGLDKLVGCREVRLKSIAGAGTARVMGLDLPVSRIMGRLETLGTGEDLSGGEGLLVANRTGRGQTFHFGFYPGVSYRDTGRQDYLGLTRLLAGRAGIEVPRGLSGPLVRVRRGTVGEGRVRPAAFVFNYESGPAPLPAGRLDPGAYRCVLSGREVDTGSSQVLEAREVLFLVPRDWPGA
ncbi:MAG: beta-galactosidase [Candidatus Glassbacteria bacterium]|nr:beta-galactosidase [Candidatus Glassbacteria bacterium]